MVVDIVTVVVLAIVVVIVLTVIVIVLAIVVVIVIVFAIVIVSEILLMVSSSISIAVGWSHFGVTCHRSRDLTFGPNHVILLFALSLECHRDTPALS